MTRTALESPHLPPNSQAQVVVQAKALTKIYGQQRAVDAIDFSVSRGETFGLLGPNGAGKSTTMRMITGFIPPSSGSVSVGGFDMVDRVGGGGQGSEERGIEGRKSKSKTSG